MTLAVGTYLKKVTSSISINQNLCINWTHMLGKFGEAMS